ncbi:hypothetical protein GBAR_LOCUS22700 [Geodia barretti]|uniref:Uncharacterized protein n=1 Tax=Geodia barretti TaxID=519541 RepID=A0AA35X1M5_GEOBA|nr:hypothetical protein GBAR_LOCUS22700 [Geodia barretti]
MVIFLIFYSGVLLTVWGQPTLYPLSIHACPNETVTYYCHGSQISVIAWEVPPYIPWQTHIADHAAGIALLIYTWIVKIYSLPPSPISQG